MWNFFKKKEKVEDSVDLLSEIKGEISRFVKNEGLELTKLQITDIQITGQIETEVRVLVKLVTLAPLIGRHGTRIKKLTTQLSNKFDKKVFISLEKSDLWTQVN